MRELLDAALIPITLRYIIFGIQVVTNENTRLLLPGRQVCAKEDRPRNTHLLTMGIYMRIFCSGCRALLEI